MSHALSSTASAALKITWEKLPADFQLPDDPVENIDHPLLAAALREALEIAGFIQPDMLIASNFGLCANVDDKIVVKAPDWLYIASVLPGNPGEVRRSYTPHAEGDTPAIVMEFLSDTEGGEYSAKPTYPYGKWFFYERILKVPNYVVFDPVLGLLEMYQLNDGFYKLQQPNDEGRYWIEAMQLYLGVWQGNKAERNSYWLRWWDGLGNLLLWGSEQSARTLEQLTQTSEQLSQTSDRLIQAEQEIARLKQQLEKP